MDNSNDLLNSANKLFLKKRFNDAISIYEQILKSEPNNIDAINNMGYALSKSKKYQHAIDCYDVGLRNNPNEKTLLINKISSLRKMEILDSALDNCNKLHCGVYGG